MKEILAGNEDTSYLSFKMACSLSGDVSGGAAILGPAESADSVDKLLFLQLK